MLAINQIHQGNALDLARQLTPSSINCVVTSPAYFNLRSYPGGEVDWPQTSYPPMFGLPPIAIAAQSVALGREKTIEAYIGHLTLIFRLLQPSLRDDGVLWINIGDSKSGGRSGNKNYTSVNGGYQSIRDDPAKSELPGKNLCGIPWRLALALQADGWILRADVIWHKTNGAPESVGDRPTHAHEYLFLFSKSPHYWYDAEAIKTPIKPSSKIRLAQDIETQAGSGRMNGGMKTNGPMKAVGGDKANRRSVWSLATAQYSGSHFAVMPEEMASLCLLAGCPEQVCDECGQPYERLIVSTGHENTRVPAHVPGGDPTETASTGWRPMTQGTNIFESACSCDAGCRSGVSLDPFMGSGTVAKVAIQNNRDWIGFDLNPEYIELANKRLYSVQRVLPGIGGTA